MVVSYLQATLFRLVEPYIQSIKQDDILKVIRNLDVNKAHGHDDISIRMSKICHLVVTKPLYITFRNYIESGIFPDTWEESHIAIHKKWETLCQ